MYPMSQEVVSELAPTGVLRAAINMGNFLLVTGRSPSGDPEGVAPDMAREIASRFREELWDRRHGNGKPNATE